MEKETIQVDLAKKQTHHLWHKNKANENKVSMNYITNMG